MVYLSIITVSHNNLDGLVRTKNSILPLPLNCEWIIIDAASTDNTKEFLENLPKQKNIKWFSEPDKGIYDGMNKGIDISNGEYLIFMNSGDSFIRESFEKISKKEPRYADFIMYDCVTLDKNYNRGYARGFPRSIDEIRNWACVQHQSTLINKRVFSILGKYSLDYRILSDYEHSVRAYLKKNITFYLDDKIKLTYFLQDGASTNIKTASLVSKEYMLIQKKYFGSFSKRLYLTNLCKIMMRYIPLGDKVVTEVRKILLNKR
jgi:glycosyltransferase involved in cell wall biosynthesis